MVFVVVLAVAVYEFICVYILDLRRHLQSNSTNFLLLLTIRFV